jgi:hypothetical protein
MDEEVLLVKKKPGPNYRRFIFLVSGAAVLVIVLIASLTAPYKAAITPARPLMLQLDGESELNRLAEAFVCPPGGCTLLESATFVDVPATLWLFTMDSIQAPVQARFSRLASPRSVYFV